MFALSGSSLTAVLALLLAPRLASAADNLSTFAMIPAMSAFVRHGASSVRGAFAGSD